MKINFRGIGIEGLGCVIAGIWGTGILTIIILLWFNIYRWMLFARTCLFGKNNFFINEKKKALFCLDNKMGINLSF